MGLIVMKVAFLAALLHSSGSSSWPATCQPLSPTGSTMQARLKSIVSATDSLSSRLRTSLSLPQGATSSVTIVTDGSVCTSLANAEAVRLGRPARTSLLVFAIGGSRYAVLNKGEDVGEFDSLSVYDVQFSYIASMSF